MTGPRVDAPAAPSRRVHGVRTGRNGNSMKCAVCRKTIPAARRKITNNKTCSVACSGELTRKGNLNRVNSYRQRQRQERGKIEHLPLVGGTDLTVRKGHVVALQEPGQTDWCLVLVVCSSQKTDGRPMPARPACGVKNPRRKTAWRPTRRSSSCRPNGRRSPDWPWPPRRPGSGSRTWRTCARRWPPIPKGQTPKGRRPHDLDDHPAGPPRRTAPVAGPEKGRPRPHRRLGLPQHVGRLQESVGPVRRLDGGGGGRPGHRLLYRLLPRAPVRGRKGPGHLRAGGRRPPVLLQAAGTRRPRRPGNRPHPGRNPTRRPGARTGAGGRRRLRRSRTRRQNRRERRDAQRTCATPPSWRSCPTGC